MNLGATPRGKHRSLARGVDRLQTWLQDVGAAFVRAAEAMPLRFSLTVVLVLEALVYVLLTPSYETIDDVLMTMAVAGKGLSLAPDQHLVFTNVLIGAVLTRLYVHAPQVPWYGLYLLLVHFVSQAAILYCALTIGRSDAAPLRTGRRLALFLFCYGLVEVQFLHRMQFTTTAFLAAQAGIFLLVLAWQRRIARSDAPVDNPLTAAVVLLVLAGMIRLESLAMALLAASPLVLLLWRHFSWRALAPCGLAVAAAAALVAGTVSYDHVTYEHDPLWQGYRALNRLRGNFHDSSWTFYAPQTAAIFSRAGWSENDHAMIARWFSDDPKLYSAAKLQSIVDAYPWKTARPLKGRWWDAFRDVGRNRTVIAILLALPLVLLVVPGGWQGRAPILLAGLATLPLLALVIWFKKVPPERVYLPLVSFPLAASLLSFAFAGTSLGPLKTPRTWSEHVRSWWIWSAWRRLPTRYEIAGTLLVVALVMVGYRVGRQSQRVQVARAALQQFLDGVQAEGRGLVVMWEAALPLDVVSPLDTLDRWSKTPMLSLAWPQRTPWQEEIKRRFGITDVARTLCDNENLVLIATDTHRALFKKFAKEHFGLDVDFVTLQKSSELLVAGCFQATLPAANTAVRRAGAVPR